jgi:DivIVA domain-containing protein
VAEARFSTARKGYSPDEVQAFLVSVAAELVRLQERERQLQGELREARSAVTETTVLDDAAITEALGEETVRVLQTARESASQIRIRAEENAARILREANDEANRLRQETEVDAARRRQEANADAETEVAMAKQQGREMVNEARAYRERVLADLDRRTTLARKQIEELLHGRDRLLQVFERARLVAVDVTSELRDIDTPDELVNLTPTTGPVPIMVPNQRRPAPSPEPEAQDAVEVPGEPDDADAAPTDEAQADETAAVEATDDGVTDDEAADNEAIDETPADEIEPTGDTDDVVDDAIANDDTDDEPVRDANVVSLFRGRPTPVPDDDADDDDASAIEDPDAGDGDDRPDVGGIFARLRDELPADESPVAATATAEPVSPDETAEATELPDTPFTRRDEALVPLIVAGARKIKRVLADEQNMVLDRLRQNDPVDSLDDLLPDLDQHAQSYADAIADELTNAAAAGAAELGVKNTKTLRNRLAKAGALDDAHSLVRTALIAPLRERLARSVADGSGDNDEITKRARAVYREWKVQHIDGQLDDVFRYAHGGGLIVSAEPGTPMVWSVDPSEPACPDCEDNSLSGAVPCGQPFPTGHTAAPAHPGCHCLVVPTD